ncbi:Doa1 protein [Saccharomycopsis crataegensis]|uniref:Doa1 protein n=1 Tax=Saccharomycopsis crataegensis TaxID=43959 RepID=A0AAV5QPF9_9ASCO|nr:Doa1 protein [Saccharomycopsis crataegensis]
MAFKEYKLSAVLKGHDQDVKDLDSIDNDTIVSASRDAKVLVWKREKDGSWSSFLNFKSEKFINSTTIVNDNETVGKHLVVSGGQDSLITMTSLEGSVDNNTTNSGEDPWYSEPEFVLLGHEKNVCSLSSFANVANKNLIISSSWDGTAIVWENNSLKYKLVGHQASIWNAQFVSEDDFITCSADKTVKLWKGNELVKTYTGIHSDVIRSLVVLDQNTFISASNDATIKFVDMATGNVLKTLSGHNSFIYQIKLLDENTLISCGEDKSVKIWDISTGKALQTIFVPSISVWAVSILENKDIVVGGSDAFIRIFSSSPQRINEALNAELVSEIQNQSINPQQFQEIDSSKISSNDVLNVPGTKEGQTIMVKAPTGVIEAYQWSNFTWQKIGEVLGGAGTSSSNVASSGKKVEYQGKYYDFVFDVDVKEGQPPLKLPFNLNDNPYAAAEKFLADNELPMSYLQEVVDFILKNTQGISFEQSSGIPLNDPYADRNPAATFITFEAFKKPLIMKGIESYNSKIEDISDKLALSDLSEIGSLLENASLPANCAKLYDYTRSMIEKGELVGYDLLRIIIKNLEYNDEIEHNLYKALVIVDEDVISNGDAAKLVMIGRCVCNLLANNSRNEKKFGKNILNPKKLDVFYRNKVLNNTDVKDSVKVKLSSTIDALKNNLQLI